MRDRWDTARTEAFSDGVFAIAVTLLVLDINVPSSELDHLSSAILQEWPAYLAYVTSFMTIGGLWLVHHGLFSRLRFVDTRLIRMNLLLLMVVSFLPFPTRLMAEVLKNPESERTAVLVYGANLFVIAALMGLMYRIAAARPELLEQGTSRADVTALANRILPGAPSLVAALALAIFTPRLAAFAYLLIAFLLVLSAHGTNVTASAQQTIDSG